MNTLWTSKSFWTTLLVVIGLAGILWWKRGPILAWYHVRQLSFAYQDNCEGCARRVAALEEAALPRLMDGLCDSDALVCANMQRALVMIAAKWSPRDLRSLKMIEGLRHKFHDFSTPGQEKTLVLLISLLHEEGAKPWPPATTRGIGELMVAAEKISELRTVSLLLAAELLDCVEPGQWVDVCRDIAERGLADPQHAARVAAAQLLMREPICKDKDLLAKLIPLLRDPEPAVRRVALLALASHKDVVREDLLIPLLHDDDPKVQGLCESALRLRGLSDDDILLARLISDSDPATRMRVLFYFPRMPDLNLVEWLRQLSVDPSPAVRAAAVRAAGENPSVDLTQRLREMAEQDPCDAVRLNAQFYLRQRVAQRAMIGQ